MKSSKLHVSISVKYDDEKTAEDYQNCYVAKIAMLAGSSRAG